MSCVLIVDDFESVRLFHAQLLKAQGWSCVTASDGHEALAILERTAVDVIILDWLMPRMGGAEFLRQLRSKPARVKIPVLVISSEASVLAGEIQGAVALAKPVTPQHLIQAVQAVWPTKGARP